jgi:hypothetical protein
MVNVTGAGAAVAVGTGGRVVVGRSTGTAGAAVAGAAVGVGALPQAVRAMDVTTSNAIKMEIILLFILSSFLS